MKQFTFPYLYARAVLLAVLGVMSFAAVNASTAVRKDSIKVWGEVSDLFSGEKLEKGVVTVYDERDSIVVVDTIRAKSKGRYGTYTYDIPAGYVFTLPHGGNYKIRFDIDGYVAELQDLTIPDRQYRKYTTDWMKNFKVRKKPREHVLGEAVVRATRIKMVVKGDTVEYDADAFNMAEGSMLDKLLTEMPGMEIKDNGEIYHNGKKVESLLVDGKDFFEGDPKMALDNLPAYAVKKVQVYQKDGDGASVIKDSLKREEMKKLVVDVKLKKQYQKSWLMNSDFAYGTHDRFSTRLSLMYFSSVWKFMAYGNLNNINQGGGPASNGDFWDGSWGTGVRYNRQGGMRLMYDKEKLSLRTGFNAGSETSYNQSETSSTTYLNAGDTYTRSRDNSRDSRRYIDWNSRITKETQHLWLNFVPLEGSYSHTRGAMSSHSVTFNDDPKDSYRLASLDSIFMPMGSTRLEQMRLNTVLNATQSLTKSTHLESRFQTNFPSPIFGNDVFLLYNFNYNDNKSENFQHYRLDNRQATDRDIRNVFSETSSGNIYFSTQTYYSMELSKKFSVNLGYYFKYNHDKNNPDRYRLDSLSGWDDLDRYPMGSLPSTQDSMVLARDLRNSYHRTTSVNAHKPALSVRIALPHEWAVAPEISFLAERHSIRDTRTPMGGSKKANLSAISPVLRVWRRKHNQENGNVESIYFDYKCVTSLPDMGYLLDLVDDTNPLFISRGNAHLKNSRTHNINFNTWNSKALHMQNYGINITWSQTSNAVASTTTYDRATGVTTYMPRNINGNWVFDAGGNVSRTIDKKDRLGVNDRMSFSYNHNVDYITETVDGIATPQRSTVHNYTVSKDLEIGYSYKKYKVTLKGGVKWRIQNSSRDNFINLNAVDMQYGISSNGPLFAGIEYDTRLSLFMRRGYNEASMNDDRAVWNLKLSRAFLKSKALVLRIEGVDLLGQLSNVSNVVNAQGRRETWYNSIPRYVMLHVCYKFNSMAKKKEANKEK
ncbi:MAG: outer membrane beta-barrel protein [Bacteroidaceae bacterium]|nr:outer membrane beta-barrel protein [Bacteroidaceae bacterium]